jgi:hypothetical protein
MKAYATINGETLVKLAIGEYKNLKAVAYAAGQFKNPKWSPKFVFQQEAYDKAIADEATVKVFLKDPEYLLEKA